VSLYDVIGEKSIKNNTVWIGKSVVNTGFLMVHILPKKELFILNYYF
jgi:hypothetical protein